MTRSIFLKGCGACASAFPARRSARRAPSTCRSKSRNTRTRPSPTPLVIGYADRAPVLVGAPEVIAPLIPLQPTTQRVFSSADRLRVFSRVFAEAPGTVKTELRLKRGTDVLKTMSLRTTPTSLAGAENCETTVTLTDLKPGAYVL